MRLSYGLYYQLDHTSHMQRIKLPGGIMTADQIDVLADVTDRYGRGIAHITTRQDIQIHWVPVERDHGHVRPAASRSASPRAAPAPTRVRNVTACPYAGVSPDEPFDVTPYLLAIHDYFLFNPLNLTLPRKFKIAVEGCPLDCAQVPVNDIGALREDAGRASPASRSGRAAGSARSPTSRSRMTDFIPADDVLVWCEAIVRIQHRHGERKNRSRARMKYVVKKMGARQVPARPSSDEVARVDAERGARAAAPRCARCSRSTRSPRRPAAPATRAPELPGFAGWAATNVRPQRQAGYKSVLVQLPLGDLTTEQLRAVGAIARKFGNGTCARTDDQNIVVPWVADDAVPAVHAALARGRPRRTPTSARSRTSSRAPAWTTARSRSRGRWAWRSASARISCATPTARASRRASASSA